MRTSAFGFVAALLVFASSSAAIFMRLSEPVPIDRLIANVAVTVEENPDDAAGYYTLGRIYSLAYAKLAYGQEPADTAEVATVEKLRQLRGGEEVKFPTFPPYETVQVGKRPQGTIQPSEEAAKHLSESVRLYAKAVELDPSQALYWLGYGWMLEQSVRYEHAATKDEANDESDQESTTQPTTQPTTAPQDTLANAIHAYRNAYTRALESELDGYLHRGDVPVTVEAAENYIRLLKADGVQEEETQPIADARDAIRRIRERGGAITPIVFAMQERSVDQLIDVKAKVRFDLSADGRELEWPWVTPEAALLVWDPHQTGRITSGTQLIGSRTWSMFWSDGYAALRALDDNRDGRLAGEELTGLAAWFDRNGNAVSDAGEVIPLEQLGIAALSTAGESHEREDVAAWARAGVMFEGGRVLPSWDWMPTSHAAVEPEDN